jgi:hypothetical protein
MAAINSLMASCQQQESTVAGRTGFEEVGREGVMNESERAGEKEK